MISRSLEQLKSLRASSDVWQLGFARMPSWVNNEHGKPYRPLVALCCAAAGAPVGKGDLCAPDDQPGPAALGAIAQLARTKGVGCRPQRVELRDPLLADAVREDLVACGIEVAVVERLDALDQVIADLMRRFGGKQASIKLFDATIEVDRLRAFAEAAVEFHRAEPWNYLNDVDLVQVDSPSAPVGLGCFNVLGAGGVERGLGFFASGSVFELFKESRIGALHIATEGLWLMGFDEIVDWPFAVSELWEEHALPAAGDRGYPSLVCHLPGGRAKPADAERLTFAEALLRALAATTEDELDRGRWSKAVRTIDGPRTVELSLPEIEEATPGAHRREGGRRGALPDRRVMEPALRDIQRLIDNREFGSAAELNAFIAESGGELPKSAPATTPEDKAQELIERALEEGGRLRIKLARDALRLWPDCAEAWVLQAEQMPDLERRRDLYRNAVEAGERALGPGPFAEHVGHFWGVLETRPYMRARVGLAGALWDMGQHAEAIAHWLDMLRLNPGDNQGIRDVLVPRLLEAGRDVEAEDVLAQFEEDASAMLAYARALIEFRRSGAGPAAQAKLDAALRENPHVPKYLTGRASLAGTLPYSYRPGGDDEARIAATDLIKAWSSTEGAIAWLGSSIRPPKRERRTQRKQGGGKKRR